MSVFTHECMSKLNIANIAAIHWWVLRSMWVPFPRQCSQYSVYSHASESRLIWAYLSDHIWVSHSWDISLSHNRMWLLHATTQDGIVKYHEWYLNMTVHVSTCLPKTKLIISDFTACRRKCNIHLKKSRGKILKKCKWINKWMDMDKGKPWTDCIIKP